MADKRERILCAANYYNDGKEHTFKPKNIREGFVICGHRHHNCINIFAQMVGFPYSEDAHRLHNTEVQGFLTSTNRFVDRIEGLIIAKNADQLIPEEAIRGDRLFSENLY